MISIIIASFNSGAYIARALNSVLQQTYKCWECIIVDGASTDNTIDIVKEFESKDSRFRHVSEPDNGIYDAFNKGWRMAKGEWIYYLGSDDELFYDAIEKLMNKTDKAMVVYGNMSYKFRSQEKYKKSIGNLSLGKMISHQSLIMKKSLLEQMRGFDEQYKITADYDLIQRCIKDEIVFYHEDCYVCKFDTTSLTGSGIGNLLEIMKIDYRYGIHNRFYLLVRFCYRVVTKKAKVIIKRVIIKNV